MAGNFFSLGGSGRGGPQNKEEEEEERQPNTNNNSNTQFLFRNDEIYNNNKGFEIWPQQSYHHNNYYSFGVGPSRKNSSSSNNVVDDVVSVSDDSTRFGFTVMRPGSSGLGSGMSCQDCGNQAKKDCPHLRCRTCCKSRGFQCQTHVKSTWVPAAKRRERQQQLTSLQQQQNEPQQQQQQQQFWGGGDHSRRHRENQGVGPLACASLPVTTTGLELGQFPPEMNSTAIFRCVKVSPMDAPDERYAYQTAVNIGGHVFKGILYDQGPDGPYTSGAGEGSSGGGGGDAQQLTLTTATTTTATANPFDSTQLYHPPLNVFMAGTQFFPPRS